MPGRETLTREKVLTAAMDLAAAEGLDGLSMRRLAKSLGVEAMSLYNHVANKADLLDAIVDRVMAQVEPADPELGWLQRLRVTALNMYRTLSPHPVVPLALVTDQANPTSLRALAPLDAVAGALYEAGFDDTGVRRALKAVTDLVFGSLLAATAGFAREPARHPTTGQLDPYLHRIDPARLPHFSRLLATMTVTDPVDDFTHGLDLLLTGLAATAPATPAR